MDVQIASILPVGHDATFGEHVVALEALYFDPYWFANSVGEWYGCSNAAERPLVRFTTEFVMATDVLDTGGYVACIFDMTPDTDGYVACNLTLHTFMESEPCQSRRGAVAVASGTAFAPAHVTAVRRALSASGLCFAAIQSATTRGAVRTRTRPTPSLPSRRLVRGHLVPF